MHTADTHTRAHVRAQPTYTSSICIQKAYLYTHTYTKLPFAQQLLLLTQSQSYHAHRRTDQDKSDAAGLDPYEVECSTALQSENPQSVDYMSPPSAAKRNVFQYFGSTQLLTRAHKMH